MAAEARGIFASGRPFAHYFSQPFALTILVFHSRYAVILAFDVRIEREAQEMADSLGVKIFSADIIYHLFDKFTAYRDVSTKVSN